MDPTYLHFNGYMSRNQYINNIWTKYLIVYKAVIHICFNYLKIIVILKIVMQPDLTLICVTFHLFKRTLNSSSTIKFSRKTFN